MMDPDSIKLVTLASQADKAPRFPKADTPNSLLNYRFWPIGDTLGPEIMFIRAAASDPKRTYMFY
jgi:hypothetical protein